MKRKHKSVIISVVVLAVLLVGGLQFGYRIYHDRYLSNTGFAEESRTVLVPTGTTIGQLCDLLTLQDILQNTASFKSYLAGRGAGNLSFGGRYTIERGMSNVQIYRLFRLGHQSPVNLVVPSTRTKEEFAGRIARQLEMDSAALLTSLRDPEEAKRLGFSPETLLAMLLPNTYQVYWNISPAHLLDRLHREWETYWTPQRDSLAQAAQLSRAEVYTLASIIQEEALHASDLPIIAGVYMNRLAQGMPLQACPTAKYAAGNLGLSRVLKAHTRIESPYNTYLNRGLPPGPIRITNLKAIEAVLNYDRNDYLYFCARADFSGYHHFSRTMRQHSEYARQYQRELNRRQIH